VDKPVKHLSGGERKRLLLARMMLEGRNVLLLDEPTNHLDTQSREVLEDALAGYDGSLLVVSHDRYFLDLLVDRVLWIEEGAWHLTRGGYTEAAAARAKRLAEALARKAVKAKKPRPAPASRAPSKKSPLARLSTEDLEEKIITLEEKRTALQFDLARPEVYRDAERTREIRAEIEQLERELAALEAEYEMRDS
jgi:ATPase subunit of ABC transporter with duplicated ATPase domains